MEDYRAWVEQACPEDIRRRGLRYGGGTKNRMPGEAFKRWFDACVAFNDDELSSTRKWLLSKGFLIAGGSSEVQRNVVAKRVLGLPD